MNNPKISVLIPMYNRKHYIKDCVDSALNQTFNDFEIIIRDDCSKDSSAEFVEKIYANEIKSGKIKLFRNEKNLGEVFNIDQLLRDATGKYLTILHCDDMYLPQTLEKLFTVAEKYSADVVHSTNFLTSPNDGIITEGTRLRKISKDRHNVNKVEVFSADLKERFNEWLTGGTFQDLQYNIFRRQFILDSGILSENICCESMLFTLIWILKAKIFVKSPETVYIRREAPDSQTNDNNSPMYKFEHSIPLRLELFRNVDKFISGYEFLKDNAEFSYLVKTRIFMTHENLNNVENNLRGNTDYVNLYGTIEDTFRKQFGSDAVYLALLFHWAHLMQFNKSQVKSLLQNCLNFIHRDI